MGRGRVDHSGIQHLAGAVHHGDLAAGPVGGVKELGNGGRCGAIVDGLEDCEKAITKIVFDEDTNRRMGEACRQHIKNYTMEKQKEKIENLLDRI